MEKKEPKHLEFLLQESKIKDVCYINRKIISKNYGNTTTLSKWNNPFYAMRNLPSILLEKELEKSYKGVYDISKIKY